MPEKFKLAFNEDENDYEQIPIRLNIFLDLNQCIDQSLFFLNA